MCVYRCKEEVTERMWAMVKDSEELCGRRLLFVFVIREGGISCLVIDWIFVCGWNAFSEMNSPEEQRVRKNNDQIMPIIRQMSPIIFKIPRFSFLKRKFVTAFLIIFSKLNKESFCCLYNISFSSI